MKIHHLGSKALFSRRLLLRPFEASDAPQMFAHWASDPEVTKTLLWDPYKTEKECKRHIKTAWLPHYKNDNFYLWGIEKEGELIGSLDVRPSFYSWEIGYVLGKHWWGNGYMPEAVQRVITFLFTECYFPKVFATHSAANPNSGRVMQKAGMLQEATLHKHCQNKDGTYSDLHVYGAINKAYFGNM